jgi:hypoxanthine phosphoribosyltransferase
MAELIPIIKKEEINLAVARLAKQISSDYKNHELVLIGVLKGAFIFLADLVRQLAIPVKLDFVCLSSYEDGISTKGTVRTRKELEIDVTGKDVLIVEDIVDTGLSMSHLMKYLETFKPKTVRICTLIDKRERRKIDMNIDYVGHVMDQGFLVGYGLDCAEDYRYLPAIYILRY